MYLTLDLLCLKMGNSRRIRSSKSYCWQNVSLSWCTCMWSIFGYELLVFLIVGMPSVLVLKRLLFLCTCCSGECRKCWASLWEIHANGHQDEKCLPSGTSNTAHYPANCRHWSWSWIRWGFLLLLLPYWSYTLLVFITIFSVKWLILIELLHTQIRVGGISV